MQRLNHNISSPDMLSHGIQLQAVELPVPVCDWPVPELKGYIPETQPEAETKSSLLVFVYYSAPSSPFPTTDKLLCGVALSLLLVSLPSLLPLTNHQSLLPLSLCCGIVSRTAK